MNIKINLLSDIWHIISDIVLPHIGRIIMSIISFSLLGILISTVLLIIMFRKKIMTRSNSAYQIIIRIIYIPMIVIICIYSFGNLGFIRGVYQVVSAENKDMVNGIYGLTVNQYFGTDREKDLFIKEMKTTLLEVEASGLSFMDSFEEKMKVSDAVNSTPGIVSSIVSIYRKEIYKAAINGVFYAADSQFNTETDHESLNKTIDMLYVTDREKIENAIKHSLEEKLQEMIDGHYHSALISNFLLWLILLSVPFIEFMIYRLSVKKPGLPMDTGNQEAIKHP